MFLISNNKTINKIYQSLQATKDLLVSSLIYGEKYIGKKTLIKQIYNNSLWVDGNNLNELKESIKNHTHIVITNFEKVTNYDILDFENINLVAIYNSKMSNKNLEEKFAFIYHMPNLNERKEDIELFKNYFYKEAKELLEITEDIVIENKHLEIYNNLKSLKKSIYKTLLYKSINKDDLEYTLYNYFLKHIKGNNIYKEQLELFEKALIKAGLKIYGSQLKLSQALGINRNTLRKKINEQFRKD